MDGKHIASSVWFGIVGWVRQESAAATALVQAFIALGIAFAWWHWSNAQTGAVIGIVSALLGMFVRSQVTPLVRPRSGRNVPLAEAGPPEAQAGPPEAQAWRPEAGGPQGPSRSPRTQAGPPEAQAGPPETQAGPPEAQPWPPEAPPAGDYQAGQATMPPAGPPTRPDFMPPGAPGGRPPTGPPDRPAGGTPPIR